MNNTSRQKVTALLAAIATLVVIASARWINSTIEKGFALQFGGKQNYKLAQQLYSNPKVMEQQQKSLQQALDNINNQKAPDTANNPTEDKQAQPSMVGGVKVNAVGTLKTEQLANLKKDTYIDGNKDATITIVEYTDPECPFCVLHHQNNTIKDLLKQYNGSVNHITKVVQGVKHDGTEYKSLAILCAGTLGGTDAYYALADKIATSSKITLTNGQISAYTASPIDAIGDYAKAIGLKSDALQSCIEKKEGLVTYNANWSEFQTFVSNPGTPGNLIINNKTGKWSLLMGAYPVGDLKSVIDEMIK